MRKEHTMRRKIAIGALAAVAAVGAALYAGALIGSGGSETAASAGVGVHGRWTIEVRDPDGTLRKRRSFENDFRGENDLGRILARRASVGRWKIAFRGPCGNASCEIVEPDTDLAADRNITKNLDIRANAQGGVHLLLAGSHVAPVAGVITSVTSLLRTCDLGVLPANCLADPRVQFTFRSLAEDDRIRVEAGQVVSARVEISFGTLP